MAKAFVGALPATAPQPGLSRFTRENAVAVWRADRYDPVLDSLEDLTGNGHHARFGSVGGASAKAAGIVGPAGGKYLSLPGVTGNDATTPNSPAVSVVGDLDVRAFVKRAGASATIETMLLSTLNWGVSGYEFRLSSTFLPILQVTLPTNTVATGTVAVNHGEPVWVRATRTAATGVVRFFTSPDGETWTQLGDDRSTTAGAITPATLNLVIGRRASSGTTEPYLVYRAQVRNGIDGPVVADFDPNRDTSPYGLGPVTSDTGEVWTINRSASDTNDPLLLPYSGEKYLYLPGAATDYASAPHDVSHRVGDLDLRVRFRVPNVPGTAEFFGQSFGGGGTYNLLLTESGPGVSLTYRTGSGLNFGPAQPHNLAASSIGWVRVTRVAATGVVTHYNSLDGVTWTVTGSYTGVVGALDYTVAQTALRVGEAALTSATTPWAAYRAQVFDGIDGTLVADFDPALSQEPHTSFVAATGETWTINRSTSGRKAVLVDKPLLLFGTDDYLQIADHADLDFAANQDYTLFAAFRAFSPAQYNSWLSKIESGSVGYQLRASASPNQMRGQMSFGDDPADSNFSNFLTSPAGAGNDGTEANGYGYWVAGGRKSGDTLFFLVRGQASNEVTNADTGASISTSTDLFIAQSGTGSYTDMEFIGAAIFRKALTPAELAQVAQGFGVTT